jgi:hypothetical protein
MLEAPETEVPEGSTSTKRKGKSGKSDEESSRAGDENRQMDEGEIHEIDASP